MTSPRPLVAFFSPYAGIWLHALPEALVSASLRRAGADILYVSCDGLLSEGCTVMSAYRLSGESNRSARVRICNKCRKSRDLLLSKLNVPSITVDSLLDSVKLVEIENIVASITAENIETYQLEGFPLGRYALHESIIHYKLTSIEEITPRALADVRLRLKHVLMTFHAWKRLFDKVSVDRIVTYNTHISTNYTLMKLAESRQIPVFGLHAGGNMSDRLATLYVFRRDMVVLYKEWIQQFKNEWTYRTATLDGLKNATQHIIALALGKTVWAYSAPKAKKHFEMRNYFGIKPEQKVLLATLSSYDELYSSQMMGVMETTPLMFSTQVEWMHEVIEYVRQRPDLFLIIRVHPREFPNLRDAVHSKHARQLAEELIDLPTNVRVNWPTENISLYDLAPQVDVGLNGWSSTGKELAMLGIPVVVYNREILFYPSELNILATDRHHYFDCIEQAINAGWSFERIRQVYRWLAVEYTLGTISIKDAFAYKEGARSLWRRGVNRLKRSFTQGFDSRKIQRPLNESYKFSKVILEDVPLVPLQFNELPSMTEAEETKLLRNEIGKILGKIYLGIPSGYSKTIDNLRRIAFGAE